MGLEIYNMVKEVIGTLPVELEFIYGLGTILIFVMLFECIFVIPWKTIFGR